MMAARRGEIWTAELGEPPTRHWVVIVSLDQYNLRERIASVLAVPFGSAGFAGPTMLRLEPGESGLPGPSYLKGHFIQPVPKLRLIHRTGRVLSNRRMRELVAAIRRSFDPDARMPEND